MYERQIEECYEQMREICNSHFWQEKGLLKTIPGIRQDAAMRIIAEIRSGYEGIYYSFGYCRMSRAKKLHLHTEMYLR